MTWGDVKLATLQLMFSNEGATLVKDDNNTEYINAMPLVANAGLTQLGLVGFPFKKLFTVIVQETVEEGHTDEEGVLTLAKASVLYKIPMGQYVSDFRKLDEVYFSDGVDYGYADGWHMEGKDTFVISGALVGTYSVYYLAHPTEITTATEDSHDMGVAREAVELLPLYMAGELYKDDDLPMAVQYRNEFEDGLSKLQTTVAQSTGSASGNVSNTTGWW